MAACKSCPYLFLDKVQEFFCGLAQVMAVRGLCPDSGVIGTLSVSLDFGNGHTLSSTMSAEPVCWGSQETIPSCLMTALPASLVSHFFADVRTSFDGLLNSMAGCGSGSGNMVTLEIQLTFGGKSFGSVLTIKTSEAETGRQFDGGADESTDDMSCTLGSSDTESDEFERLSRTS